MTLLSTGLQLGQTLRNAARLRQIVGVFAKHGFHNVLERANLGRFILRRITKGEDEKLNAAERARLAFEELGPTFVKLGQLLATRPNLIPKSFVEEFKKFHDQVAPLPFSDIEPVIKDELGDFSEIFARIDPIPIAAASIGQVHTALLKTGEEVVIKVQRPGILDVIQNDLGVLYQLASLLETYIPESRTFTPITIVDEFFKTLELETNFIIEAQNLRKIAQNFLNDSEIKIPKVYIEFCTPKVLVMERIRGIPLSDTNAVRASNVDLQAVVSSGLRAFFKMVFRDGLFHGDLHAGNLFIMGDGKIGVVDFGVVGRLSEKTRNSIANMLIALAQEDYEALTYEYLELAPFNSKVDFDLFQKEIRDLIAPYHGVTFKDVNFGKIMMDSTSVAAKYSIIMPSELMLYFKAVVTVEGMGRSLIKDFDFMAFTTEFSQEIIKQKLDPQKFLKEIAIFGRDSSSLILSLPRQLKQLLRKLNSRDFAIDLNIRSIEELRRTVETNSVLNYLGLVISALIISGTMALSSDKSPLFFGFPALSLIGYIFAFLLSLVAFYNYVRK